jgi:hypothetical protein
MPAHGDAGRIKGSLRPGPDLGRSGKGGDVRLGDGNDSFHEFTHRREGAQSVRFRRLSEKQFFVVTADRDLFSPLWVAFLPTKKPEKSIAEKMVAVRVFQERSKPVEMGLFTKTKPMCELVEGIVTIPRELILSAYECVHSEVGCANLCPIPSPSLPKQRDGFAIKSYQLLRLFARGLFLDRF